MDNSHIVKHFGNFLKNPVSFKIGSAKSGCQGSNG